jgi:serine/threonine-protein kinase
MKPEKIGRYEIKAELGRGGMATVYRAYDPQFEREVAIKVLPPEMLHDPRFRARFKREAKTIAMLEHPAIVPVYDFGEEEGQLYFVMRYMPGGSLSDLLKKGPLSVEEAARIMDRLVPALDEAHSKGIIHRDMKPGNILFDRLGDPYISDFGIAKLSESQTNVTGSAILGTPAYMSPEQAQGEAIDGRSDIYSLGVILFEMLSGKAPYEADTPMGVVVKHITEPVPHILDVNPNLPPPIETIIEKAMAKNKGERFTTAIEMSSALNTATLNKTLDLKSSPTRRITPAQTVIAKRSKLPESREQATFLAASARPHKKKWLWIGLGMAVLLLVTSVFSLSSIFKNKLPPLIAPTTILPTQIAEIPSVPTLGSLISTKTPEQQNSPIPSNTPAPSPTPTLIGLPVLGGADLIAFLNGNNVWIMNVDGNDLSQLTTDGTAKHDLQWMPDGNGIIYISGKCIQIVDITTKEVYTLTCFLAADYLEAFQISPDSTQVAISISRELYVVPFNIDELSQVRSRSNLGAMKGCLTYNKLGTKGVRWSSDGLMLAIGILAVGDTGLIVDEVRVMDIHSCSSAEPRVLDTFPGPRFTMLGYSNNPIIPSFDWDGMTLFLLNSSIRNDGYGYLYGYNLESHKANDLDPLSGDCCYRDARWSPDGSYILFAYQNINLGVDSPTQLFYIPYGTIGIGATYTSLPLPDNFFQNPREKPQPAMRPSR